MGVILIKNRSQGGALFFLVNFGPVLGIYVVIILYRKWLPVWRLIFFGQVLTNFARPHGFYRNGFHRKVFTDKREQPFSPKTALTETDFTEFSRLGAKSYQIAPNTLDTDLTEFLELGYHRKP